MIYKGPSIYKQGLSIEDEDVLNILQTNENISLSFLPKYSRLTSLGGQIKYNKNTKLLSCSFYFNNTGADFYPHYDTSDPAGSSDWPCIASGDFPETIEGTKYIDFLGSQSGDKLTPFSFQIAGNKIYLRALHIKYIYSGWTTAFQFTALI